MIRTSSGDRPPQHRRQARLHLHWESAEHLAAMQRSPEFQAIARPFAGLIEFEPNECEVVHVGERG
jgi:quinol monooxygenase YgiN